MKGMRTLGVGFCALVVLILLLRSITIVPAGHAGVPILFGRVTGEVLSEGIHMINPLKGIQVLSVRTQNLKETASVPSNEGMIITLDTSLLFRLDKSRAAEVYQKIGPQYVEVVVEPLLRAALRSVTANNSAKALYTGEREKVAQEITAMLVQEMGPRGIVVESALLRDIKLPQMLTSAIESKQQAEQEALRMNFILQKERQEAERKRIEAQGISDFQSIVSKGISDQLLKWKGIEATEKLATSNNSKVVVIGGRETGLPLILQ